MEASDRPLITFLLVAYNQECFIREAVEGSFSQTYCPLEIVLTDDCSTDRTFDIMKELADAYIGPHRIILNRNEINLGVGAHLNRCMEIVHGELIVGAAGDDISLPERTTEIYRAWVDSGKTAFSLDSLYEMIDESGHAVACPPPRSHPTEHQLLHFSKTLEHYVIGCTHAWHRNVFDVFGPLPNITLEDVAIPPRSMLLGRVVRVDKPLVKYRTHRNNLCESSTKLTGKEVINRKVRYCNDRIDICADVVRCINEKKDATMDPCLTNELNKYILSIEINRKKLEILLEILTGYPIIRLYFLFKYISIYKLQRHDSIFVICALSKAVYRLYYKRRESIRFNLFVQKK